MKFALTVFASLALSCGAGRSLAQTPLDGYFIAREACPATQNIKAGDNPGEVVTQIDRAYPLLGKNADHASHFLIAIAGHQPTRRWVAVSCGERVVPVGDMSPMRGAEAATASTNAQTGDGAPGQPVASAREKGPRNLLAVSWQPAFCQTHRTKAECASQTRERYDADHFALHGLWPQPRGTGYCNVPEAQKKAAESGRWDSLPALALSARTRQQLDTVMPGTQSNLQRHEWTKHGSCFGNGDAEAYFQTAIALMDRINASSVRDLFASHIGQSLSGSTIRGAFEQAFGAGAGKRVTIMCRGGLIAEIRVAMRGEIGKDTPMGTAILAAEPVPLGCRGGRIDRAGF